MSSSRIQLVRSAVTNGLKALAVTGQPLDGVLVSYAWKVNAQDRERIFTNRARGETPPAALRSGRNFRAETGRFDLVVRVESVGGSPEDADTRALALGLVVEEYLADRKSNGLGVSGLQTLVVEGWDLLNAMSDNGSLTELTYHVRYTARLT